MNDEGQFRITKAQVEAASRPTVKLGEPNTEQQPSMGDRMRAVLETVDQAKGDLLFDAALVAGLFAAGTAIDSTAAGTALAMVGIFVRPALEQRGNENEWERAIHDDSPAFLKESRPIWTIVGDMVTAWRKGEPFQLKDATMTPDGMDRYNYYHPKP